MNKKCFECICNLIFDRNEAPLEMHVDRKVTERQKRKIACNSVDLSVVYCGKCICFSHHAHSIHSITFGRFVVKNSDRDRVFSR